MIHRMPGYIFKLEKNTHFYPLPPKENPALNWEAPKSGCSNKISASGFWCVFFLCALNETAVSYFFPPPEALAVGHTVTHARQVFDCFTVNSESIELCLRITFLIASTFSCSGHVTLLQHFWLWLSPLKWIIRANQVFFHPEVAAASLQSFFFFGLWSVTLIDFFGKCCSAARAAIPSTASQTCRKLIKDTHTRNLEAYIHREWWCFGLCYNHCVAS